MEKTIVTAQIAVDPVVLTINNGKAYIYLQIREKPPFKGLYELPGGLLANNETAKETLNRKLTALFKDTTFFQQFHTFTNPNRDPRSRVISIGYIALIRTDNLHNWYPIENLPKLAFDHELIIKRAMSYLKQNLSPTLLKHLLPKQFPLNQLQSVYETLEQTKYDNRNFRKKMISAEIVKETKAIEENVSHRPAKLYQFKE